MKLTSGFLLSNGATIAITRPAHSWHDFDVKITCPDAVEQVRLGRLALRVVLQDFRKTGVLRVKRIELTVPTITERIQVIEQAEAVMREEI